MGKAFKTGASIVVTVDTERDFFGLTGFKASYIDKATGTATSIDGDFTEVLKTVDGNTASANGICLAGTRIVNVDDGTKFEDGDVISDANGNNYYILSIDGNALETKTKLKEDIADSDTITQVGNTGLYTNSFSIPTPGEYNVLIYNPSANMQNIIVPVSVQDEVIDDMQQKLDDIKSELGITRSEVKFTAYV